MKTVSVREFQLHAKQYLKDLPIVLTQYNLPIATIIPQKSVEDLNHNIPKFPQFGSIKVKPPEDYIPPPKIESSSRYPLTYLGKPLSGRKEKCPVCNEENIPTEFATTHYNEKHSDI
jgi:antitoxin (DNA-binding transcriptional repressor) of toxin-antitoxin stability system